MPVLVVATTVGLLVGPAGPAAADDPPGTVQVTPTAPGIVRDVLVPVAGSPDDLAYEVIHQFPGGQDRSDVHLVDRAADGTVVDLGVLPADPQGIATSQYDRFSLVGGTLSTDDPDTGVVSWWDVRSAQHATVTLPDGYYYVTGAPGGFVVGHGTSLYRQNLTGQRTSLGTPFAGTNGFYGVVAGDDGLVAWTFDDDLVYTSFADPGEYTTLSLGVATSDLTCEAVVGAFAACSSDAQQDVEGTANLVPIDGRPATVVRGSFGRVAVSGDTLIWASDGSLDYGDTPPPTVRGDDTVTLDSAYGQAVYLRGGPYRLFSITSAAASPSLLVTADRGPVGASSLSLSPGRLVYNDDRQNGVTSPFNSSTFQNSLTTSADALGLGPVATLQGGSYQADAAGSGTTTVYSLGPALVRTDVLHAARNSRMITGVVGRVPGQLSGNRYLYEADRTHDFRVYDSSTGRTTPVPSDVDYLSESGPALSGSYLAFFAAGSVNREDLRTQARVELAPSTGPRSQIFAAGDWVAWTDSPNAGTGYLRNARTMAPTQRVTGHIVGLSSAGAVTLSNVAQVGADHVADVTLHTYAGQDLPLLSGYEYAAVPQVQVEGSTLAWLTAAGVLKVAHLDILPARPGFLGATIVPKALARPGHVGWQGFAPFSAPLTSCRVVIRNPHSVVVAVQPCAVPQMRVGVADFSWDGTYHGTPVHAGRFTYTIESAGDGGASVNGFGDPRSVVGAVAVG